MTKNDIIENFDKALNANNVAIASGACNYNPHLAVRKKHEEVGLHSNFLYSLLYPQGDHFRGGEFLYSFLTAIKAIDEPKYDSDKFSSAIVTRERHKIDLLVEAGNHWYIIENKIYASDQNAQISRYINTVKEKYKADDSNITVIYLTLSGFKPSKKSLASYILKSGTKVPGWKIKEGSIKSLADSTDKSQTGSIELVLASYTQVKNWCDECLAQSYVMNSPVLYYSIASYKQVLDRLLGKSAAGIPPLDRQHYPVMTHTDFFLSLTDTEKEEFIKASSDNCSYDFLNKNLIANGKIKSPTALLQSIFNNLLLRFRDGVYSEAAKHGFVIANARDGFKLNDVKLLETPINWYTQNVQRTGKHQFMAFKPRTAEDGFWYVIYFAKYAFYQGFIEVDAKTNKLNKLNRKIIGFKEHEYEPYKDKIFQAPWVLFTTVMMISSLAPLMH